MSCVREDFVALGGQDPSPDNEEVKESEVEEPETVQAIAPSGALIDSDDSSLRTFWVLHIYAYLQYHIWFIQ